MNTKNFVFIFGLIGTVFFTACDDDDDGATSTPQSDQVQDLLMEGSWTIQSLIDDGEDETADYADYVLTYHSQGQVEATHTTDSALTRSGTYSVFWDDGQLELDMSFDNADVVDDLDDDWYFVSQSGNTIVWDDSGDVLILQQQ